MVTPVIVNVSLGLVLFFKRKTIKLELHSVWKIGLVGLIVAAHWVFFYSGIKLSNISITMIAFSSGTFFTAFIEPIAYKRKIIWNEVIIGFVIICVITGIGYFEFENAINPILGIVLGVLAAFTSALFSTINGKLIEKTNAFSISFIELVSANIWVTLGMVLFFEIPDNLFSPSGNDILHLLVLGIVCTAVPFIISVEIMKKVSPFTTNLALNLESVYAIILGFVIFGETEKMTPSFYIGGIVILGLILLNEFLKRRRKN